MVIYHLGSQLPPYLPYLPTYLPICFAELTIACYFDRTSHKIHLTSVLRPGPIERSLPACLFRALGIPRGIDELVYAIDTVRIPDTE